MSKSIPANSVVIFHMSTPPLGWVKETSSFNDHTIRLVTGNASSGGSINFSAKFTTTPTYTLTFSANLSAATVDPVTLSTVDMASHDHTFNPNGPVSFVPTGTPSLPGFHGPPTVSGGKWTTANGGGSSHTHPIGNIFSTTTVSSNTVLSFNIKYIDVIRARRQ